MDGQSIFGNKICVRIVYSDYKLCFCNVEYPKAFGQSEPNVFFLILENPPSIQLCFYGYKC